MPQMSQVLRERAIYMLTAGMSTRAVACELNVHLSTISSLQRRFREFGSTSNRPHNCRPSVTTPPQDIHVQHLYLQDHRRLATRTAAATIGSHNQIISEQTIRNGLSETFKMHRDTVTRSWGPLLCHSSTSVSCCSMIMHGPMLQGSVHNSWKLKTSQFLHGQHTSDMSPIEHVWDALDRRIWQRDPVPANIQQLPTAIEEEWTNIPQATINNLINSMRRRCVALREANAGHTIYWLVFRPPPQYSKTAHFRVAFYCGQPKSRLCNNHAV